MNGFKAEMTKHANALIIDRELHAIETNQKQVKPIQDKFLGQIYKMHYTTFRKLKMFKSTSWYSIRFKLIRQSKLGGSFILFVGDDVKKLATDATPMLLRIRAEDNAIKLKVSKEYPVAQWMSKEAQINIHKIAVDDMELDIVQVISRDRCYLFYKSKLHGNERLKAQYYYRTRSLIFDVEK